MRASTKKWIAKHSNLTLTKKWGLHPSHEIERKEVEYSKTLIKKSCCIVCWLSEWSLLWIVESRYNCNWRTRCSPQRKGTGTGGLRNKKTSGDHQNYSIVEIGHNTEMSRGDLRRLAVSQTPEENHLDVESLLFRLISREYRSNCRFLTGCNEDSQLLISFEIWSEEISNE